MKVEFKILKSEFVVVFHRPDFEEGKISNETDKENNPSEQGINVGLNDGINVGLNTTEQKVLEVINSGPKSTAKDISEKIGLKPRTIERAIKELKDKGIIERKGSRKSGYWLIK